MTAKTKIILFSSLIFFSFILKAQDLNKIKKQNVFFVIFENCELTKKTDVSTKSQNRFNYYFFKKSDKEEFKFSFNYSKYPTYDDESNDINERMVYRVNKSFLRKNKDIIITRKFMEKVGEYAIIDLLFRGNKHIFIIDKSEMKNNKILLREVRFDYTAEE
tara:strand:+ start:1017 stop:1499 length:483 start_codon:yes stop_codon:yes gene_type:complete